MSQRSTEHTLLRLEYVTRWEDVLSLAKLTGGAIYRKARAQHWLSMFTITVVLLLGFGAARRAADGVLQAVFGLIWAALVPMQLPYKKRYWKRMADSILRQDWRTELTITDKGITEMARGIESFAPWSSITSFAVSDDRIFISLSNGLWAIIPGGAFGQQPEQANTLLQTLKEKGVAEHTETPAEKWWQTRL